MISFVLIFFVMIIAIGATAVLGFATHLKRRAKKLKGENQKQFNEQPPPYRSLFEPTPEEAANFRAEADEKMRRGKKAILRQNLIERANDDDFTVLNENLKANDPAFYDELLGLLTERAVGDTKKIVPLAKFVSENELPANESLARNILAVWKKDSSALSAAEVLHVAALTDSAENYLRAADEVFAAWKRGELKLAAGELFALVESHYRLLSNEARTSSAGFQVKEKLAELREEFSKE